jgi:acyl-coenzyme A synthetase/AMP-(fatty) acid ligase
MITITTPTLAEHLKEISQQYHACPAIIHRDAVMTYGELFQAAESLANLLENIPSNIIGLMVSRNKFAYISIISCLLANKTYMPFSEAQTISDHLYKLNISQAKCIIVDPSYENAAKETLEHLSYLCVVLFVGYHELPYWAADMPHHFYLMNGTNFQNIFHLCHPSKGAGSRAKSMHGMTLKRLVGNDMSGIDSNLNGNDIGHNYLYLLFTSGSTGKPKGVAIREDQVIHYINNCLTLFQIEPRSRFSQIIDLTFDLSVHEIFLALSSGSTLCVFDGSNAIDLYKYIKNHEINYWISVPSTAVTLHQAGSLKENAFPSLKYTFFCGEPLTHHIAKKWSHSAPHSKIINLYGPTEATIAFTYHEWLTECSHNNEKIVPIGKPFPGLNVPLIGEKNEIYLSGSQVAEGYFKNSEKTNENFVSLVNHAGTFYRTGDLGLLHQNILHFKGRMDDQLQLRGCRIEKIALESLLKEAVNTQSVAIIPIIYNESTVSGYVAFFADTTQSIPEIRHHCQNSMPSYLLPSKIIKIDHIPNMINGKIDYCYLQKLADGELATC